MITLKKIKIYSSYQGDIDAYARTTINKEPEVSDKEWFLIDGFIQDLSLVKRNKASKYFEQKLFERLKEKCESQIVIDKIIDLANKL